MAYRVKNWASFQHYKQRNPPWIKLHKSLLDDYTFQRLPIASKALAPMLWLLASETKDGVITASDEEIAFRLRISIDELSQGLRPLIAAGFVELVQDASNTLAPCKQVAMPETETEREAEREAEEEPPVFEIAKSHPKLSHLKSIDEIPYGVTGKILEACLKDGDDAVLVGTRAYADSLDNPKFAKDPYKFFAEFMYRRNWSRDTDTGILDELRQPDESPDGELGQFVAGQVGRSPEARKL